MATPEACTPAAEFYKSKALRAMAVLALLSLAIAMIVRSYSQPGKAGVGSGASSPASGGPMATYSREEPICFGPSKRVELDLRVDEWSPIVITPEHCKNVYLTVNPPVGYRIRFSNGKEYAVGPAGLEDIPPQRMEFRLLGVQPGQKAVVHVRY